MIVNWLVSPYFFDQFDLTLQGAAPEGTLLNGPHDVPDRSPSSLARVHRPIREFVYQSVLNQQVPISIAGDCSGSLPVMSGLQDAGLNPVLVWLDAHTDFNTHETSPTGFLGGMPMAMMVGRGQLDIPQNVELASVPESDVWQIGARDFDGFEHEVALLDESEVNQGMMEDLANLQFSRPVHLHIDNDVINAIDVPANNYVAPGGPSALDTEAACIEFIKRNNVVAISFSGWNGELDHDGKTQAVCRKLLASLAREIEGK